MTIHPIGAASVALFITPADLKEYGISPEELTRELVLEFTKEAFQEAGLCAEGPMEIEAYPDSCGVLVFARLNPPTRAWFVFKNLEDLLAAARCLFDALPDATLTLYEGQYWLSVPAQDRQSVCRLTEFAAPAAATPFFDAHIAEHGAVLLPGQALSILMRWFPN
ncbi:MAG: hypothetical protein EOM52_03585 [Clostridia bacterium]|nr:hypothetical protein [Clostridia bacterium]